MKGLFCWLNAVCYIISCSSLKEKFLLFLQVTLWWIKIQSFGLEYYTQVISKYCWTKISITFFIFCYCFNLFLPLKILISCLSLFVYSLSSNNGFIPHFMIRKEINNVGLLLLLHFCPTLFVRICLNFPLNSVFSKNNYFSILFLPCHHTSIFVLSWGMW